MGMNRAYGVVAAVTLVMCALTSVVADTIELVNYEFENRVAPNNTVVVSATPSGNLSQAEFGTLRVVTNVIRESADSGSAVLGSVVGLVNTLKDDSLFLTFNFVYETADWNGTLALQGRLSAGGDGELVVTGGSGDFRFATGYCDTTLVAASDPANIMFKNVIHLKL